MIWFASVQENTKDKLSIEQLKTSQFAYKIFVLEKNHQGFEALGLNFKWI